MKMEYSIVHGTYQDIAQALRMADGHWEHALRSWKESQDERK